MFRTASTSSSRNSSSSSRKNYGSVSPAVQASTQAIETSHITLTSVKSRDMSTQSEKETFAIAKQLENEVKKLGAEKAKLENALSEINKSWCKLRAKHAQFNLPSFSSSGENTATEKPKLPPENIFFKPCLSATHNTAVKNVGALTQEILNLKKSNESLRERIKKSESCMIQEAEEMKAALSRHRPTV